MAAFSRWEEQKDEAGYVSREPGRDVARSLSFVQQIARAEPICRCFRADGILRVPESELLRTGRILEDELSSVWMHIFAALRIAYLRAKNDHEGVCA
uniref:Uncharacterized protein n=1 Tax=Sphaerodactylus townsendi TaxID=933632 RepID=A0ACB8EDN9_9SAUR